MPSKTLRTTSQRPTRKTAQRDAAEKLADARDALVAARTDAGAQEQRLASLEKERDAALARLADLDRQAARLEEDREDYGRTGRDAADALCIQVDGRDFILVQPVYVRTISRELNTKIHTYGSIAFLKKIWFYKENGTHFQPNDNTVAGKKVQFYWPADPDSPFIKKSHQRTYTVKRPDELSCDGTNVQDNANDATNTFPPHDKRIGCVPKI